MTHKVHPKAFRIKKISDWDSRGFYDSKVNLSAGNRYKNIYEEDFKIREFLQKKLEKAGIEKIEIERFPNKINIIISAARPGIIIGRGGEEVENIRKTLEEKILNKNINQKKDKKESSEKKEIKIEIREVKNYWTSAALVSQWVAQQLEKRIPFRKVLKQALSKISVNKDVKGAKIEVSGRLDGNEIARREWLKTGRVPLQTLRSDIDFAKNQAFCTYGTIGIKVWIYKGEKFD
ncbi:MAG TPA: 30S ribosomal protein S3 [Candidatus Pacearchaeota archaeon]|nr:30S ribosomal protein S3 [Candidatus Paceibacterota bacterium]HOK00520.1 30S ribosomal protein S3 [Candidatus Pacearchaeota archaeon]HOL90353.1 30S ribosomal protein S3 [Candidatus Pacearchaeota archaeon]HOW12782.1 30S ribosomal protein S3 [Candidatus Pacearchaeota archaeon]HPO68545.1 30S ribosomal protein S3 [Candidatus Pacearchaeota archaeon]